MRRLFNIGRIVLAFLLIYLLLRKVDLRASLSLLQRSSLPFLLLAIFLFFLFVLLSNIRWKVLLDAKELSFSRGYLLKVYFISLFFNNILPTAIGGDAMRVAYTARKEGIAKALSVTLMDRAIGFVGLFFFALLSSLALITINSRAGIHYLTLNLIGFSVVFGGICALLSRVPYRLLRGLWTKIRFKRLGERADRFVTTLRSFQDNLPALFYSFLLSLFVQLTISFVWYFSGRAIIEAPDSPIRSPLYYFLYIPLIGIITVLPITLGGLGVRENAFVYFFRGVGLTKEEAFGICLLFLLISYLYSLIGGLMFIFCKKR